MGGQQSKTPRTVSYENDSSDGLIDISEDVVNRLKGQKGKGANLDYAILMTLESVHRYAFIIEH